MVRQIVGHRVEGLSDFTKDIEIIGYYTDKDISQRKPLREYAHAQYLMVPSILDLNNTDLEHILFVCSTPTAAIKKISEIGAQPIMSNDQGVFFAKKRK